MIVKVIEDTELDIYVSARSRKSIVEKFVVGEKLEFDILDDYGDDMDIQFGDGTVSFGVFKDWFEILEED